VRETNWERERERERDVGIHSHVGFVGDNEPALAVLCPEEHLQRVQTPF